MTDNDHMLSNSWSLEVLMKFRIEQHECTISQSSDAKQSTDFVCIIQIKFCVQRYSFFVCKNTKYTRQIPVENQINEITYVQLYESCNKKIF